MKRFCQLDSSLLSYDVFFFFFKKQKVEDDENTKKSKLEILISNHQSITHCLDLGSQIVTHGRDCDVNSIQMEGKNLN